MRKPAIIVLLFILLIGNAQDNNSFKFNELLSFKNKSDFPAEVFGYFQNRGLKFLYKKNFTELIETEIDLSKCNKYYYNSSFCSVSIEFCEGLVNIPLEDHAIRITIGYATELPYNDLVKSIKANCVLLKVEEKEFNDLPMKVFHYKHSSGVVFTTTKYFIDNEVNYFIMIFYK